MENIYRFKKRMVFPEKLILDQVDEGRSASTSWCNEPLENHSNVVNVKTFATKNHLEKARDEERRVHSASNESATETHHQFIQDRIRHLVDAFSTRAHAARQRLDGPETPSSLSSSGEMDNNSTQVESKPRLSVAFSDKYEQDDGYEPEFKITTAGCLGRCLNHIQIVDPNGKTYVFWMFVVTLAVLYNAWVIPLRSTFPYQTAQNRAGWMTFDYIADIIYIIDVILIQPRVKYLHEGFWVTERNLLRQNFIKNKHFKLDVMSLIPLDLLYFITGPDLVILRFPRFFKMHTFWEFFSLVDRRLANPYTIRITKTFIYMMYLIHLNACAYYAFSIYEGIGSNSFVYNGQGNAYIKCFYFATKTATSIGKNPKPSQELEYIFMTFSWLMGVFVFALLIGQIRDIISTATRSKTEYRKLVDETLEYMRRMNLPQEMQRRVQLWFSYTWETQHTLDENNIMDCLPHKMKTDIAINVHIQTLSKVKLFADCDEALRRELVLELKSVIYLPGDIICKKGDIGTEMYIIQSGKVQVIGGKDGNEVLATLSEGSVFGEISLLGIPGMNRRTADVRSYGYSNLFVLDKTSLNQALSHYPEAQDLLNKKAKMLMKKNAALERKNNAMIVIKNPTSPEKHAKLLETVLQVLPPDSKSNRLLRYGSRQAPRRNPANDRFKYRNSLPAIKNYQGLDQEVIDNNNDPKQCDVTDSASSSSEYEEEAKITVHRTLS
ncbi:cyclic nucleotide-gated cation channel beta-1 [Anthonomus grandis grandis]|uniref:cyclic nucleotide-gated cation channel beta-1 n=1 Tax=Anthonomus grandis grandis TaxID=2921223 RepID=UPI0021661287|nr:cyclic nucleotide-gated cation channel beta-1 [Anthonomus grandis grandis]